MLQRRELTFKPPFGLGRMPTFVKTGVNLLSVGHKSATTGYEQDYQFPIT